MLTFLLLLGLVHAVVGAVAGREPLTGAPYGTKWLVDLARLRAERHRRLRRPPWEGDAPDHH